MQWDQADKMRCFFIDDGSTITKYAHYLYDAGGNRVKKLVRNDGGSYTSTTYIDGIFEHLTDGTETQNTLHVMDDKSRIAMLRVGAELGDTTPVVKYVLENHLGDSVLELASDGSKIEKEEYYPFGETSFASYGKKRYKYNGKERDEESGMYNYGMRYYSAWTCRFVSVDPIKGEYPELTPFQYASNRPINMIDLDGLEGLEPQGPIGPGYYQANVNTRMTAFSVRHPIAAASIGLPTKGSTNISTNSVRFSTRIGLNENLEHEGSQVNAFRHVLWQAEITQEFGASVAKQVGNLHEENPFSINICNLKTSFSYLSDADETIDLLNNVIGRMIGRANPNATMQELAIKTIDYYKEKGLWIASPVTNDSGEIIGYTISQEKLGPEQYDTAKGIIQNLNTNGFTQKEQQKLDADAQKKMNQVDRGAKF